MNNKFLSFFLMSVFVLTMFVSAGTYGVINIGTGDKVDTQVANQVLAVKNQMSQEMTEVISSIGALSAQSAGLDAKIAAIEEKVSGVEQGRGVLVGALETLSTKQNADTAAIQTAINAMNDKVGTQLSDLSNALAGIKNTQDAAAQKAKIDEAKALAKKARMTIIESKTGLGSWESLEGVGSFGKVLRYIFGPVTEVSENMLSAMIITLAVWLLVLITFGDIIASFSSFSKWVAWSTAFLIGVIAANLGFITKIVAWFTGGFAIFGITSVYLGLAGAFVAFIVVNLGIKSAGSWIMDRKAMMQAQRAKSGGKRLVGAIQGLKQVGAELEK